MKTNQMKNAGKGLRGKTWGLSLVLAAGLGLVAIGDEYDVPVRPIGVDGQPAWNVAAQQFMYAPTFGFNAVDGAVRYRFTVEGSGVKRTFEAERMTAPLTPVWAEIPVGDVCVTVTGVSADGKDVGLAGSRRFWKMPPFREGAYPKAVRGYGETAGLIWKYIFNRPYLQYMLDKGEPDPTYPLNSYPSKMLASQIWAMLRYAKLSPADAPRAMKIAKAAADRLIARAQPAGSPLEYFPPTYDGRGEAGNNYLGDKFKGMHMLHYPSAAGEALLDYAAATGETSYRDFAFKIADTYVRLQGEDGTWWLKMDERSGKPVCENRLVPIRVLTFLERVAKLTGEAKYAAAAERAFGFIEKGPLTDWNWEGQFEDIYPAPLYANLTKHGACDVAIYLLRRFPGDRRRLAQARELLRWSEDQFVVWDGRYNRDNIAQWTTPVALEQYHCYEPIDESAAKLIMTYLALYRAERNPRDLAKARAIGDAFTRVTLEDGRLRTYWKTDSRTNEHEDWVNGQVVSAFALEDLATFAPASQNPGRIRPLADDCVAVVRSPDPAKVFCYSPGICRLDSGRLVVTCDFGGPGMKQGADRGRVLLSDDRGATWKMAGTNPLRHSRPFLAGGRLYVVGHDSWLGIVASDDDGEHWSAASRLAEGRWHGSACNVWYAKGNVYLAIEVFDWPADKRYYGWSVNRLKPILMRAKETDDLTKRESWTFSESFCFQDIFDGNPDPELEYFGQPWYTAFTKYQRKVNGEWKVPDGFNLPEGASYLAHPLGWLETNVVQIKDPDHVWYDPSGNTFHLFMRANTSGVGYAALAKVTERPDGTMTTSLEKAPSGQKMLLLPFPGGQMRFHLLYDEQTRLYWLLSTQATDTMCRLDRLPKGRYNMPYDERQRLQLSFSKNMYDWCFAGIVSIGPSVVESRHYASMAFDGDDIVVVSRSGTPQASSPHDGDVITFHRVTDFRSLVY